jgi:hypothetical protein
MRTTVSIDDPLLENAKRHATERGVTLGGLIEDALRTYLANADREADRPFRLHTVGGRLVNRNLDLDRISTLIAADDEETFKPKRRR